MKVRIFNDGKHAYATQITDVETGKSIEYVTRVDLTVAVRDEVPKALLTVIFPVVDVIADAEIQRVCPVCGKSEDVEETKTAEYGRNEWKARIDYKRLQDEQERQVKMLIRQSLYHVVSETVRLSANSPEIDGRIDAIADDLLHCLNNLD